MSATVLVGLAVTSHDESTATVALFDGLKLTATTATTNKPPAITISAPAPGTTLNAGTDLAISATASDPDGTITRVEFYLNGSLVGADTSGPYTARYSASVPGTYALTAVATDDRGATTTSAPTALTVAALPGTPSATASVDVGAPRLAGSFVASGSSSTITAAGRDIWDTADQFHFVYQQVTGDIDVRARLASLRHTDGWAKAGVMIRDSLAAGSRHAYAAVTAENGYVLQHRSAPAGWSDSLSGGWGTAPGWVRLRRTGTRLEAFRSSDGTSWTSIGAVTVEMSSTVLVGLAVTSHNEGSHTVAVFDNLAVGPATSTSTAPRAIAFTASDDHASLVTGYVLEIYGAGVTPGVAPPLASLNLGKPAPSSTGEVVVECSAFFLALPAGSYQATVKAIGSSGSARSEPETFTR